MSVILVASSIQYRNPTVGQATLAIPEHYAGRRVTASVKGEEMQFRFGADELPLEASPEDIVSAIESRIEEEV